MNPRPNQKRKTTTDHRFVDPTQLLHEQFVKLKQISFLCAFEILAVQFEIAQGGLQMR